VRTTATDGHPQAAIQQQAAQHKKRSSALRIKIISMGAPGVGKSCLIKRYCEEKFVAKYIGTIGVDYGVKVRAWLLMLLFCRVVLSSQRVKQIQAPVSCLYLRTLLSKYASGLRTHRVCCSSPCHIILPPWGCVRLHRQLSLQAHVVHTRHRISATL